MNCIENDINESFRLNLHIILKEIKIFPVKITVILIRVQSEWISAKITCNFSKVPC